MRCQSREYTKGFSIDRKSFLKNMKKFPYVKNKLLSDAIRKREMRKLMVSLIRLEYLYEGRRCKARILKSPS